jgi:hypothetical protein
MQFGFCDVATHHVAPRSRERNRFAMILAIHAIIARRVAMTVRHNDL